MNKSAPYRFTAEDEKAWREFVHSTIQGAEIIELEINKAASTGERSASIQGAVVCARAIENRAAALLENLGRANPHKRAVMPKRHGTPLELLNTPANRRLADALREAYYAARAVDAERGLDEDESLSGLLQMFSEGVEQECYGSRGTGE